VYLFRSFDLSNLSQAQAGRIYIRLLGQYSPVSDADYKLLQDYLFRYIAAERGRLGMPVYRYSISGGGSYFSISGAHPLLLEPPFNQPAASP